MKEKKDALSKAAQDLAVKLYQQNGGAAGQAGPQAGPQGPQGGNSNNATTVMPKMVNSQSRSK